jgi:hypothetical protein
VKFVKYLVSQTKFHTQIDYTIGSTSKEKKEKAESQKDQVTVILKPPNQPDVILIFSKT